MLGAASSGMSRTTWVIARMGAWALSSVSWYSSSASDCITIAPPTPIDVSSRDIEGENPLYLPQAKVYDGSCAIGPGILLSHEGALANVPIQLSIERGGQRVFEGQTSSGEMKRTLRELCMYLGRELSFPQGAFLMTGTGIVPPDTFSLEAGDLVRVQVANAVLENEVAQ